MFKIQMYYPTDTLICIFGIRTRVLLIIFKLDLFFFSKFNLNLHCLVEYSGRGSSKL